MSPALSAQAHAVGHDPIAAAKIARLEGDIANLASSVKQLVDDTRAHREALAREREEDRKSNREALAELSASLGREVSKLGSEVYKGTDWTVILAGVGLVVTLFFGFSVYNNERFSSVEDSVRREHAEIVRVEDAGKDEDNQVVAAFKDADSRLSAQIAELYGIARAQSESMGRIGGVQDLSMQTMATLHAKVDSLLAGSK